MIFTTEMSSAKGRFLGAVMFLYVLPVLAVQPQNPAVGGTYAQFAAATTSDCEPLDG